MAFFKRNIPRTQKPSNPAALIDRDWVRDALHVFLFHNSNDNKDFGAKRLDLTFNGNQYDAITSKGRGIYFGDTTSDYGTTGSIGSQPPSTWTFETCICIQNTGEAYIAGYQESPGNNTQDRRLGIDDSGNLEIYLYDGSPVYLDGPALTTGEFHRVICGTDGSTLHLTVNGTTYSTSVSNGGYTGYASPEFIIGAGDMDVAGNVGTDARILYFIVHNRYITPEVARARTKLNDFSLFYPNKVPLYIDVGNITESIPSGVLNLTGIAPNVRVTGHVRESVPSSNLTLTSFAPTAYVRTANVTEQIPSANLALTSFAPTVSITGHVRESIPNSNLQLNSFAPTVYQRTDNIVERPPSANLNITAFAPNVSIVGNVREKIPNSVIQLSSYSPTIRNTSVVPSVRPTGGISKRVKQQRKPKPRIIMVDGKTHQIESPEQELFILQAYRDKLEKQYALDIVKKKVPAVKRKIKLGATNIKRVETRINKVKERISWLKKEDEEILAILAA